MIENEHLLAEDGKGSMADNVKLLIYKNHPALFELLDFENDDIFLEPLVFAFFNKRSAEGHDSLESILYGYIAYEWRKQIKLTIKTDEFGRSYMPQIGWFITDIPNAKLELQEPLEKSFNLLFKGKEISFELELPVKDKSSGMELYKYPIEILNGFFTDRQREVVDIEVENITEANIDHFSNALNFFRDHLPEHYETN